jgi:pSer/pThr/pTyr-binding forkhead associated (FHA) protein
VLDERTVSRQHTELRSRPAGVFEIVDLDAHNGTNGNGRLSAVNVRRPGTATGQLPPPAGGCPP